MADVLVRLAGPLALAAAAATVYTVGAGKTSTVRQVRVVCETASTTATFTMSIGTDGAGKRVFYQQQVLPGDGFDWTGNIVLAAGEVLQAYASAAATLTLMVCGVESS